MEQKKHLGLNARLERRAILRLMAAMPAGALFSAVRSATATPKELAAELISPEAAAPYQPRVFNPHEWKTVHALCDLIIPADERSASATAAGVPEFIDDWLDLQRGDLLSSIRGGLTWLDIECNRLFGTDFIASTPGQQEQILDRIAYPKKAAPEDASAVAFFNHFRDLVVSGFFTSETGIKDLPYLGNEPQSEWQGCPTPVLAKLGLVGERTG
ncbi:MAG: gluconate 2-dehydrogenase subunit 3 family protein [Terriglobia bacterium]